MTKTLLMWLLSLFILAVGMSLPLFSLLAGEFDSELPKVPSQFNGVPHSVFWVKLEPELAPWAEAHDVRSIHPFREVLLRSKEVAGSWDKQTILKFWKKFGGDHFHSKSQPPAGAWRFLRRYPRQYVVHELAPGETIQIDGQLADPAWAHAAWTKGRFVDITYHQNRRLNRVPRLFQTRAKLRWDKDFLYVGAERARHFHDRHQGRGGGRDSFSGLYSPALLSSERVCGGA